MEQFAYIVVFVTTTDTEEAQLISKVLLDQKKVACVNIVPRINSSFWWQDKIDSVQESLLIIKTKASQLTEVVRLVKELHHYEVPEIIAIPIIGGNQDYLEWIGSEIE
jgi:periplasmic divalent cation tolerance protein